MLILGSEGPFDRSQNWEPKCYNFWSPFCTVRGSVGAVWASWVLIYAINHALMCMRPEMAMDFGFTK